MHYFKRSIGDYHRKAGRLSMLQHGAYTLLMDACYDREEFPTMEQAVDWCWASSKEEIESVEFVLRKFFVLENGVYIQQRISDAIEKFRSNSKTNQKVAIDREAKKREKRAQNATKRERTVNEPSTNSEKKPHNHKPLTINQEPGTNKPLQDKKTCRGDVNVIFECWCKVFNKKRAKLTKDRKARVTARLKEGYTVDQIKSAIIGCASSPHHMGVNTTNTVYDDLELICRSGTKLENFIDMLDRPPPSSPPNNSSPGAQPTRDMSFGDQFDTSWADQAPNNHPIDNDFLELDHDQEH